MPGALVSPHVSNKPDLMPLYFDAVMPNRCKTKGRINHMLLKHPMHNNSRTCALIQCIFQYEEKTIGKSMICAFLWGDLLQISNVLQMPSALDVKSILAFLTLLDALIVKLMSWCILRILKRINSLILWCFDGLMPNWCKTKGTSISSHAAYEIPCI